MTKTTNNQQRTLFKTKPNKAKVKIGNIDRMQKTDVRIQKFTRLRWNSLSGVAKAKTESLSAVGGSEARSQNPKFVPLSSALRSRHQHIDQTKWILYYIQ
jgi:hypothetical protein